MQVGRHAHETLPVALFSRLTGAHCPPSSVNMANRGVFTEVIPKTRDAWYRLALMVESLPTVELIGELLDPYEIHSARFFFKAYITIPARTSAHYTKPGMAACMTAR